MKQQKAILTPKGMQKDTSVTVFSSEFAFDIKNMRFTATNENSFMCLTNEKSNIKIPIYKKDVGGSGNSVIQQLSSLGTILGVQSLSDYCIVFRKAEDSDIISKITYKDSKLYIQDLYEGNLKFNTSNPIESIGIYETENIHKVYWIDGINQPRVINPSEEGIKKIKENNDSQFDFIPIAYSDNDSIKVNIQKKKHYSGLFPAGVLQYAISYFNTNLQESNIIYQSPLLYTSSTNRGTSAEDTSPDVFEITIEGLNKNFEYIKIYRILRTSIDAVPSVELVGEYKTTSTFKKDDEEVEGIYVVDSGTTGSTIDPASLLYLGGEPIYPKAITHKDNTLFLGNITLNNPTISNKNKEYIKDNSEVWFDYIDTEIPDEESDLNTQYLYVNSLDKKSSEITFFQKGETYRIGIQLSQSTGDWSEVIYLGDFKNDKRVVANNYNDSIKKKPIIKAKITLPEGLSNKYVAARLVCVYPSFNEREVLCQGLVLPTVYNVKDRVDNSPYVQSSWFARPSCYMPHYYDMLLLGFGTNRENALGFPLEFRASDKNGIIGLPDPSKYNAEIQYGKSLNAGAFEINIDSTIATRTQEASKYYANFGIDKSILTFHSPELDLNYDDKIYNFPLDNVKFKIIGYVPVKTTFSDIEVQASNPFNPYIGKFYYNKMEDKSSPNHLSGNSLSSFPFWVDSVTSNDEDSPQSITKPEDTPIYLFSSFPIYPWHRAGSLNNMGKREFRKSVLDTKVMSNLRIGLSTRYLEEEYTDLNISNIELFNSNELTLKKLNVWGKEIHYQGNIDTLITVNSAKDQPLYVGSYIQRPSVDNVYSKYDGIEKPNDLVLDPGLLHTNLEYSNLQQNIATNDINSYSTDSLPIQYKSLPHAVFAIEKNSDNKYVLLPNIANKRSFNATEEDNINIKFTGSFYESQPQDYNIEIENNTLIFSSSGEATPNRAVLTLESPENWLIENIIFFVDESSDCSLDYPYLKIDNSSPHDDTWGYYDTYVVQNKSNVLTIYLGYPNGSWRTGFKRLEIKVKEKDGLEFKFLTLVFNNNTIVENKKVEYNTNSGSYLFEYGFDDSYTPKYSSDTKNLLWEKRQETFNGFYQPTIIVKDPLLENLDNVPFYFILGEFYRENISNKFGGNSESILSNNKWLPCGNIEFFYNNKVELIGDQGDTYFQRYDLLKTIPYSENCINNIIDITSFCCETRINIDGRYDRNRGLQDNTYITPNNFNLFNKVYSQQNNFFTQQYLDSEKFNSKNFPNQVTWSKTKTLGEEIDTWTSINLANILDLDGDKGDLQKLLKFNNNIYAIQDRGVSAINFNPRVQINASDGVPIEISNGGKVDGKIYISEKYGTTNKWSVVETPSGFYFVDGINQEILACNGKEFSSLTMTNKMYSWLKDKDTSSVWSPVNTKAIRALYDSKNKDIYFTNDYEALSFSELSSTFTSRYSYGNVGWLFNFDNDTYQIYSKYINNSIWKLHGGDDYGYFFDENKHNPVEYSIEYVVNDNFAYDKIFDTVELLTNDTFIADRTGNMYPFSTLQTQNEYQESMSYSYSMKKKFRIWRWPIGRNNRGAIPSKDRIRNTWIKLKLSGNRHDKIQLYNTSVIYYV